MAATSDSHETKPTPNPGMEKEAEKYWRAKEVHKIGHCQYFKLWYIAMVASILIAIIAIAASPEELRDGNAGCGECVEPCILCREETGLCGYDSEGYGRCFCAVERTSIFSDRNDSFCRTKVPVKGGFGINLAIILILFAVIAFLVVAWKSTFRGHHKLLHPPQAGAEAWFRCKARKQNGSFGIALADDETNGEVYVKEISHNSPFQKTLLRVGMKVFQVDDSDSFTLESANQLLETKSSIQITGMSTPASRVRTERLLFGEGTNVDGSTADPESNGDGTTADNALKADPTNTTTSETSTDQRDNKGSSADEARNQEPYRNGGPAARAPSTGQLSLPTPAVSVLRTDNERDASAAADGNDDKDDTKAHPNSRQLRPGISRIPSTGQVSLPTPGGGSDGP